MCLFSDICCHVVLLHYTIKTRNSDTRFGQAKWMHSLDCRSAVRLVTVVWNILWTFCVSLRTAAGSSDTWGYTWRRHSADCAHKGSKGHWTFKIFQALLLHGDVRSNMADASFICFVLWTTGTTWSYDRLVSFLLLHFFFTKTSIFPSFVLFSYFAHEFWISFLILLLRFRGDILFPAVFRHTPHLHGYHSPYKQLVPVPKHHVRSKTWHSVTLS